MRKRNYLSYSFPIGNGLKQKDALSPLLFNFALEYAIRRVQETNLGLDTNTTHEVLAYADGVNLICHGIGNAEVLLNVCKDTGLALNSGKTKYMEVGSRQSMMGNEHRR